MMNRDLWGSFILSLKPVLAQGAVPLCLQDISIPSLVLISTFVNWPGRNFLSGQVSPQCSVNGRSSLEDTRGIVNISAGECRKLETEYSWSYLLTHFPERLRFCLQIGWTNESRVKQACAPQCLFGAAFCFWRAVPVGETGKYITCKTCISFDLVKVPWCLSYSSFLHEQWLKHQWILTLTGLGGSHSLTGESSREQPLSAWTCSLSCCISSILSLAVLKVIQLLFIILQFSCTVTTFPSCIPTGGFISKLFIISERSLMKASHIWPQADSLKISGSQTPSSLITPPKEVPASPHILKSWSFLIIPSVWFILIC